MISWTIDVQCRSDSLKLHPYQMSLKQSNSLDESRTDDREIDDSSGCKPAEEFALELGFIMQRLMPYLGEIRETEIIELFTLGLRATK